jgi:cathepsin L
VLRKFAERWSVAGGYSRSQADASSNNKVQHWRYANVTPPAAADWRTAQPPILGPIKDQHIGGAPCGSCWVS